MNFKRLITRLLLGSFLLAQVPQVCGMQNNQNQANSRDEYSLRDRRRLERRVKDLSLWMIPVLSVFIVNTVGYGAEVGESVLRFYKHPGMFNMCLAGLKLASLPLCAFFPYYVVKNSVQNNPERPSNLTPLARDAIQPIKWTAEWLALNLHSSNVDVRDAQGMTTLMRAARNNSKSLVQLAVACGAHLDAKNTDSQNALMHAIDADDVEIVRMLLLCGAQSDEALNYINTEISRCEGEITALALQIAQLNANADGERSLQEKNTELVTLRKIQALFSQTPAQLVAPLTAAQKAEYKKMFAGREQVKPSLHGSLMLYEHFDDAAALRKYLKFNGQIHQGIANKKAGLQDVMPNIMSFLREQSGEKEQRLKQALRKAIMQKDEELSQLLVKNGVELDIDEKISAQFN